MAAVCRTAASFCRGLDRFPDGGKRRGGGRIGSVFGGFPDGTDYNDYDGFGYRRRGDRRAVPRAEKRGRSPKGGRSAHFVPAFAFPPGCRRDVSAQGHPDVVDLR